MITCDQITKDEIRAHYDWATPFYRLLWGQHIHHGLWEADETPRRAQIQLIERLTQAASIGQGTRVLDVGCGMGGSSIHLARHVGCDVTGLTLSPVQRWWACTSARLNGVAKRTRFLCQDVERATFAVGSFDVVWSVECTEHLFDKERFFHSLAGWLKPGGRMVIAAWLASEPPCTNEAARQLYDVCEGFLCPSLGSASDYRGWMESAGMRVEQMEDISDKVARTWEICDRRVRRSCLRWIAPLAGRKMVLFLKRFEAILAAYRSGAMRYGYFVAHKDL